MLIDKAKSLILNIRCLKLKNESLYLQLEKIEKILKLISKYKVKLNVYPLGRDFNIFKLKKFERQRVFHLCNKIYYFITNLLYLVLKTKKLIPSKLLYDDLFNLVMICINELNDIKVIMISVIDKNGFQHRSDNKIHSTNNYYPNNNLYKFINDNINLNNDNEVSNSLDIKDDFNEFDIKDDMLVKNYQINHDENLSSTEENKDSLNKKDDDDNSFENDKENSN